MTPIQAAFLRRPFSCKSIVLIPNQLVTSIENGYVSIWALSRHGLTPQTGLSRFYTRNSFPVREAEHTPVRA